MQNSSSSTTSPASSTVSTPTSLLLLNDLVNDKDDQNESQQQQNSVPQWSDMLEDMEEESLNNKDYDDPFHSTMMMMSSRSASNNGGDDDDDDDPLMMKNVIEDDLVRDAISKELDLREYDQSIARELRSIEIDSIQDYLAEAEKLSDLHTQLSSFDEILGKMEDMLVTFQSSLGNMSDDIKQLQSSSYEMNVKLKNTNAAEKLMREFVKKVAIPPSLVIQVCDAPIDEKYVSLIEFLDQQLRLLDSVPRHLPCFLELEPMLKDLTSTAVYRVKQSLLEKIKAFGQKTRKNVNNQVFIQQKILLKYKPCYDFLETYAPMSALEIRREYCSILSSYYLTSFSHYTRSLIKRYPSAFVRGNYNISTIVENNIFDISSIFNAENASKTLSQYFCLKDRYHKCTNQLIPLATAQTDSRSFEELWTSIGMLLINTASAEFVFCLEMFNSMETCNQLFSVIFSATLKHLYSFLETWVNNTLDCVAILIVMRKIKEFQQIISQREISEQALSVFWGRVKKLCLDRFIAIMDANVRSVQTLLVPNALTANITNRESKHFTICKKYAHLCTSIQKLGFSSRVEQNLRVLTQSMQHLLNLMAKSTSGHVDHVLLINCVDSILKIFLNNDLKSSLVREWSDVLVSHTATYVEQLLTQPYIQMHRIVVFLHACEPRIIKGEDEKTIESNRRSLNTEITIDSEQKSAVEFMGILAEEFQQTRTKQLQQMYEQIESEFPNKQTTQEIFQKSVLQFILYYIRFGKIVTLSKSDARSLLVPQTKLQHEVSSLFEQYFRNNDEQQQQQQQ